MPGGAEQGSSALPRADTVDIRIDALLPADHIVANSLIQQEVNPAVFRPRPSKSPGLLSFPFEF